MDNWTYDETTDTYTHPESWVYQFDHLKHNHTTTDFRQENMVYKAEQADLASQKGLYVNERYQLLKVKESQALLSPEGRQIFAQRKIDVETVFGQIL